MRESHYMIKFSITTFIFKVKELILPRDPLVKKFPLTSLLSSSKELKLRLYLCVCAGVPVRIEDNHPVSAGQIHAQSSNLQFDEKNSWTISHV